MLPCIHLQCSRQRQHIQVVIAPAARPDDEQHDQIYRQIRQRPLQPAPDKAILRAELFDQRHDSVDKQKSKKHKQCLINKKCRGSPIIPEKQSVRPKRQYPPQHGHKQFWDDLFFCRCVHVFSFHRSPQRVKSGAVLRLFCGAVFVRCAEGQVRPAPPAHCRCRIQKIPYAHSFSDMRHRHRRRCAYP